MSLRRLTLGIGSGLFDKIVVTVIQLLLVPMLVNSWGLTLFGIWAMLSTVPTMLALSDFGITVSAWARMTMFVSRGDVDRGRGVLHTAWLATVSIGLGLTISSALLLYLLPAETLPRTAGLSEMQARTALFLMIVYGLGNVIFRLITVIFQSSGNMSLMIWCNTASFMLENVALLVAVWFGADILTAAAVLLAARCLSIACVFILGHRRFQHLRLGFNAARRTEWAEMWRPALSAALLGFGVNAFLQLSVMILGVVAGAAAVPAFVAVRTLSRVGLQLSMLVAHPVAQEFGQEMAGQRFDRAGRYFGLVLVTSVLMSVGIAGGLTLLGTTFVRIWTAGAIEASFTLMLLMAISSAAAVVWNPLSNLVSAVNRQGAFANTNVGISAVGLGLIALTGDRLGPVAAGLAFAVVDVVTMLAVANFLRRHWWAVPEFRSGCLLTIKQMRNPLSTIKSLRQRRA